ncbi:hypothetical protein SDC9_28190 [bioreactor metagenome]|jgi:hypothetical protein|uniref:Cytochrome c domain-containing protein n=1 Tax=bioreactor metagenome TaxID=1076179 RepID=A0A644UTP7_9ZZZZ|nr:hypothetical protein [Lentimicrobium sp.]MEA5109810.1 hypothetical protein [Lentimicrobium sp.]HCT71202.1 hypothetical protein [Bacteroidales bacterium]
MKKRSLIYLATFLLIPAFSAIISSCEYEFVEPDRTPITTEVSFATDIVPIFNASCNFSGCHAAGAVPPDLSPAGAYNSLILLSQVNTSDPLNSVLYKSITTGSMKSFSNADQAKLILAWIQQGAKNN